MVRSKEDTKGKEKAKGVIVLLDFKEVTRERVQGYSQV